MKSVDLDGNYAYSEVKVVHGSVIQSLQVFPNPAKDYVNIGISGSLNLDVTVRLINQAGQVLAEQRALKAGGTTITMYVSQYPTGNYLLQVSGSDGSSQTKKLLITK